MSPRAVISRHPETIATEIDDEIVLMSLLTGRTYGLDNRGGKIWSLIEQPRTLEDLVMELLKKYETTAEKCRADTGDFLGKLAEAQLVVVNEPAEKS